MMKFLAFAFAAVFPLVALAGPGQQTACGTGNTCVNDSTNGRNIVTAENDPTVQERFYNLWMGQCQNIYSELSSVNGHTQRVSFCQSIAAKRVPPDMLVSAALSPTVITQILCTQGTTNDGCAADADINTAIDAALTVTGTSGLATRSWP